MGLKNYQFNTILREYDNRRLQSKYELDHRKEIVYDKIPELKAIDDEMIHDSIQRAKSALMNDSNALVGLKERNEQLTKKKRQLIKNAGFPEDYLELHYVCPLCKDTGYIDNEKCNCFKQAIVNLLYSQSNVKDALMHENFSTFSLAYYDDTQIDAVTRQTPLSNIKNVLTIVKSFISNFDQQYDNLLIYGNTGVGKTFLSNCIAKELLDSGHTVIYLTSFQLFDILEKYKFNTAEDYDEIRNRFEYILDCDLLIIDDIGTEMNNTFITSQLYQCINERHLKQKSTIISTNLSFEQLKNNYSERIFSRISSNYRLLKIIGDDIRLQKLLNPQRK
ncbi:MAG: ATP-binding protein [Clostridiales bacterium]|nr:ATP-binding protein [Clostridiales bacterium]